MLTLVPTPLGNLEDITFRAVAALKAAQVVLCEDTRVAKKLLTLLSQKFDIQFGQKRFLSLHEHNQSLFFQKISAEFFDSEVVYLSDAGMPGISDPGSVLVQYAQKHGIDYTVLPGPSAFVTAYVASGFGKRSFCFFGFLPHKGKERSKALDEVLSMDRDVVLYESPHRLEKLLEEIAERDPHRELFLAKELTKLHERYFKADASSLLKRLRQEPIKGEWVVVIEGGAHKNHKIELSQEEIMALHLPPKEKAKLLARSGQRSVKEWYRLLNDS